VTMTANRSPQRQEPRAGQHIARPEPEAKVRAVTMTITPDIARSWLDTNTHNRTLHDERVRTYARDIRDGNWYLSGDAIKFDRDGTMLDGQHRLWAVVEADRAIESLVVFGVAPEAQKVMDTGRKRSATDMLTLEGEDDAKTLAAAITLAIFWGRATKDGDQLKLPRGNAFSVTHSEVLEFLAGHPDIRDAVKAAHNYRVPNVSPAVRAFVLWKLRQVNYSAADTFLSDMATMNLGGAGDPRAALVRRLTNAAAQRERLERSVVVVMMFRTWNAWRTGKSIAKALTRSRMGDVQAEEPV
jgi:hypothetical protein